MSSCSDMARTQHQAFIEWRADRLAGVTPEAARAAVRYVRQRRRGDSAPPPASLPPELQAFFVSVDDWRALGRETLRFVFDSRTRLHLPGDLLAVGRWREVGRRLLAC